MRDLTRNSFMINGVGGWLVFVSVLGVDINRCADRDLENTLCGFCSSKKPITEIKIEGKTYEIKSTLLLQILFSAIGTTIISLIVWQLGYENLTVWIMGIFISKMIIWHFLLGEIMLKEKGTTI